MSSFLVPPGAPTSVDELVAQQYGELFDHGDNALVSMVQAFGFATLLKVRLVQDHIGKRRGLLNAASSNALGFVRTVFGGAEESSDSLRLESDSKLFAPAVPRVDPALVELYIRLPLFVRFYKSLLFDENDKNEGEDFYMVLGNGSPFENVFRLVAFNTKLGDDSSVQRAIIEECNTIAKGLGNAQPTAILNRFIDEVNRSYGLINTNAFKSRKNELEKRLSPDNPQILSEVEIDDPRAAAAASGDLPRLTLDGESPLGRIRESDYATYGTLTERPDNNDKEFSLYKAAQRIKKLRERIQKFDALFSDNDGNNLRDQSKFDLRLGEIREAVARAASESERYLALRTGIANIHKLEFSSGVDALHVLFNELVLFPVTTARLMLQTGRAAISGVVENLSDERFFADRNIVMANAPELDVAAHTAAIATKLQVEDGQLFTVNTPNKYLVGNVSTNYKLHNNVEARSVKKPLMRDSVTDASDDTGSNLIQLSGETLLKAAIELAKYQIVAVKDGDTTKTVTIANPLIVFCASTYGTVHEKLHKELGDYKIGTGVDHTTAANAATGTAISDKAGFKAWALRVRDTAKNVPSTEDYSKDPRKGIKLFQQTLEKYSSGIVGKRLEVTNWTPLRKLIKLIIGYNGSDRMLVVGGAVPEVTMTDFEHFEYCKAMFTSGLFKMTGSVNDYPEIDDSEYLAVLRKLMEVATANFSTIKPYLRSDAAAISTKEMSALRKSLTEYERMSPRQRGVVSAKLAEASPQLISASFGASLMGSTQENRLFRMISQRDVFDLPGLSQPTFIDSSFATALPYVDPYCAPVPVGTITAFNSAVYNVLNVFASPSGSIPIRIFSLLEPFLAVGDTIDDQAISGTVVENAILARSILGLITTIAQKNSPVKALKYQDSELVPELLYANVDQLCAQFQSVARETEYARLYGRKLGSALNRSLTLISGHCARMCDGLRALAAEGTRPNESLKAPPSLLLKSLFLSEDSTPAIAIAHSNVESRLNDAEDLALQVRDELNNAIRIFQRVLNLDTNSDTFLDLGVIYASPLVSDFADFVGIRLGYQATTGPATLAQSVARLERLVSSLHSNVRSALTSIMDALQVKNPEDATAQYANCMQITVLFKQAEKLAALLTRSTGHYSANSGYMHANLPDMLYRIAPRSNDTSSIHPRLDPTNPRTSGRYFLDSHSLSIYMVLVAAANIVNDRPLLPYAPSGFVRAVEGYFGSDTSGAMSSASMPVMPRILTRFDSRNDCERLNAFVRPVPVSRFADNKFNKYTTEGVQAVGSFDVSDGVSDDTFVFCNGIRYVSVDDPAALTVQNAVRLYKFDDDAYLSIPSYHGLYPAQALLRNYLAPGFSPDDEIRRNAEEQRNVFEDLQNQQKVLNALQVFAAANFNAAAVDHYSRYLRSDSLDSDEQKTLLAAIYLLQQLSNPPDDIGMEPFSGGADGDRKLVVLANRPNALTPAEWVTASANAKTRANLTLGGAGFLNLLKTDLPLLDVLLGDDAAATIQAATVFVANQYRAGGTITARATGTPLEPNGTALPHGTFVIWLTRNIRPSASRLMNALALHATHGAVHAAAGNPVAEAALATTIRRESKTAAENFKVVLTNAVAELDRLYPQENLDLFQNSYDHTTNTQLALIKVPETIDNGAARSLVIDYVHKYELNCYARFDNANRELLRPSISRERTAKQLGYADDCGLSSLRVRYNQAQTRTNATLVSYAEPVATLEQGEGLFLDEAAGHHLTGAVFSEEYKRAVLLRIRTQIAAAVQPLTTGIAQLQELAFTAAAVVAVNAIALGTYFDAAGAVGTALEDVLSGAAFNAPVTLSAAGDGARLEAFAALDKVQEVYARHPLLKQLLSRNAFEAYRTYQGLSATAVAGEYIENAPALAQWDNAANFTADFITNAADLAPIPQATPAWNVGIIPADLVINQNQFDAFVRFARYYFPESSSERQRLDLIVEDPLTTIRPIDGSYFHPIDQANLDATKTAQIYYDLPAAATTAKSLEGFFTSELVDKNMVAATARLRVLATKGRAAVTFPYDANKAYALAEIESITKATNNISAISNSNNQLVSDYREAYTKQTEAEKSIDALESFITENAFNELATSMRDHLLAYPNKPNNDMEGILDAAYSNIKGMRATFPDATQMDVGLAAEAVSYIRRNQDRYAASINHIIKRVKDLAGILTGVDDFALTGGAALSDALVAAVSGLKDGDLTGFVKALDGRAYLAGCNPLNGGSAPFYNLDAVALAAVAVPVTTMAELVHRLGRLIGQAGSSAQPLITAGIGNTYHNDAQLIHTSDCVVYRSALPPNTATQNTVAYRFMVIDVILQVVKDGVWDPTAANMTMTDAARLVIIDQVKSCGVGLLHAYIYLGATIARECYTRNIAHVLDGPVVTLNLAPDAMYDTTVANTGCTNLGTMAPPRLVAAPAAAVPAAAAAPYTAAFTLVAKGAPATAISPEVTRVQKVFHDRRAIAEYVRAVEANEDVYKVPQTVANQNVTDTAALVDKARHPVLWMLQYAKDKSVLSKLNGLKLVEAVAKHTEVKAEQTRAAAVKYESTTPMIQTLVKHFADLDRAFSMTLTKLEDPEAKLALKQAFFKIKAAAYRLEFPFKASGIANTTRMTTDHQALFNREYTNPGYPNLVLAPAATTVQQQAIQGNRDTPVFKYKPGEFIIPVAGPRTATQLVKFTSFTAIWKYGKPPVWPTNAAGAAFGNDSAIISGADLDPVAALAHGADRYIAQARVALADAVSASAFGASYANQTAAAAIDATEAANYIRHTIKAAQFAHRFPITAQLVAYYGAAETAPIQDAGTLIVAAVPANPDPTTLPTAYAAPVAKDNGYLGDDAVSGTLLAAPANARVEVTPRTTTTLTALSVKREGAVLVFNQYSGSAYAEGSETNENLPKNADAGVTLLTMPANMHNPQVGSLYSVCDIATTTSDCGLNWPSRATSIRELKTSCEFDEDPSVVFTTKGGKVSMERDSPIEVTYKCSSEDAQEIFDSKGMYNGELMQLVDELESTINCDDVETWMTHYRKTIERIFYKFQTQPGSFVVPGLCAAAKEKILKPARRYAVFNSGAFDKLTLTFTPDKNGKNMLCTSKTALARLRDFSDAVYTEAPIDGKLWQEADNEYEFSNFTTFELDNINALLNESKEIIGAPVDYLNEPAVMGRNPAGAADAVAAVDFATGRVLPQSASAVSLGARLTLHEQYLNRFKATVPQPFTNHSNFFPHAFAGAHYAHLEDTTTAFGAAGNGIEPGMPYPVDNRAFIKGLNPAVANLATTYRDDPVVSAQVELAKQVGNFMMFVDPSVARVPVIRAAQTFRGQTINSILRSLDDVTMAPKTIVNIQNAGLLFGAVATNLAASMATVANAGDGGNLAVFGGGFCNFHPVANYDRLKALIREYIAEQKPGNTEILLSDCDAVTCANNLGNTNGFGGLAVNSAANATSGFLVPSPHFNRGYTVWNAANESGVSNGTLINLRDALMLNGTLGGADQLEKECKIAYGVTWAECLEGGSSRGYALFTEIPPGVKDALEYMKERRIQSDALNQLVAEVNKRIANARHFIQWLHDRVCRLDWKTMGPYNPKAHNQLLGLMRQEGAQFFKNLLVGFMPAGTEEAYAGLLITRDNFASHVKAMCAFRGSILRFLNRFSAYKVPDSVEGLFSALDTAKRAYTVAHARYLELDANPKTASARFAAVVGHLANIKWQLNALAPAAPLGSVAESALVSSAADVRARGARTTVDENNAEYVANVFKYLEENVAARSLDAPNTVPILGAGPIITYEAVPGNGCTVDTILHSLSPDSLKGNRETIYTAARMQLDFACAVAVGSKPAVYDTYLETGSGADVIVLTNALQSVCGAIVGKAPKVFEIGTVPVPDANEQALVGFAEWLSETQDNTKATTVLNAYRAALLAATAAGAPPAGAAAIVTGTLRKPIVETVSGANKDVRVAAAFIQSNAWGQLNAPFDVPVTENVVKVLKAKLSGDYSSINTAGDALTRLNAYLKKVNAKMQEAKSGYTDLESVAPVMRKLSGAVESVLALAREAQGAVADLDKDDDTVKASAVIKLHQLSDAVESYVSKISEPFKLGPEDEKTLVKAVDLEAINKAGMSSQANILMTRARDIATEVKSLVPDFDLAYGPQQYYLSPVANAALQKALHSADVRKAAARVDTSSREPVTKSGLVQKLLTLANQFATVKFEGPKSAFPNMIGDQLLHRQEFSSAKKVMKARAERYGDGMPWAAYAGKASMLPGQDVKKNKNGVEKRLKAYYDVPDYYFALIFAKKFLESSGDIERLLVTIKGGADDLLKKAGDFSFADRQMSLYDQYTMQKRPLIVDAFPFPAGIVEMTRTSQKTIKTVFELVALADDLSRKAAIPLLAAFQVVDLVAGSFTTPFNVPTFTSKSYDFIASIDVSLTKDYKDLLAAAENDSKKQTLKRSTPIDLVHTSEGRAGELSLNTQAEREEARKSNDTNGNLRAANVQERFSTVAKLLDTLLNKGPGVREYKVTAMLVPSRNELHEYLSSNKRNKWLTGHFSKYMFQKGAFREEDFPWFKEQLDEAKGRLAVGSQAVSSTFEATYMALGKLFAVQMLACRNVHPFAYSKAKMVRNFNVTGASLRELKETVDERRVVPFDLFLRATKEAFPDRDREVRTLDPMTQNIISFGRVPLDLNMIANDVPFSPIVLAIVYLREIIETYLVTTAPQGPDVMRSLLNTLDSRVNEDLKKQVRDSSYYKAIFGNVNAAATAEDILNDITGATARAAPAAGHGVPPPPVALPFFGKSTFKVPLLTQVDPLTGQTIGSSHFKDLSVVSAPQVIAEALNKIMRVIIYKEMIVDRQTNGVGIDTLYKPESEIF